MQNRFFQTQQYFNASETRRMAFLAQHGLSTAWFERLQNHCPTRRYYRFQKRLKTVILMESIPDHSSLSIETHRIADFIKLNSVLNAAGLKTPDILGMHENNGYLLLEDLGNINFISAFEDNIDVMELCELGLNVLICQKSNIDLEHIQLKLYHKSHLRQSIQRLVDWYAPMIRRRLNDNMMIEEFNALWRDIEKTMPEPMIGMIHGDFHFGNLMYLKRYKGLKRAGILDFQGAMIGPLAYDMVTLLNHPELPLPRDIQDKMLTLYCSDFTPEQKDSFFMWYEVLKAQYFCRLLGEYIQHAVIDEQPHYLEHLNRLAQNLNGCLLHPILSPLKDWCTGNDIVFDRVPSIDVKQLYGRIRKDAM